MPACSSTRKAGLRMLPSVATVLRSCEGLFPAAEEFGVTRTPAKDLQRGHRRRTDPEVFGTGAPVYVAAILEYLAAEVLSVITIEQVDPLQVWNGREFVAVDDEEHFYLLLQMCILLELSC